MDAAVGKNWLPTLILALASTLVCTWAGAVPIPDAKWLRRMQALGGAFLLSGLLSRTHAFWPGRAAEYAVPGILLLLAAYAVWRERAVRAASVLRYGVYLVFLLMAIAGIRQMKPEFLLPGWHKPRRQQAKYSCPPLPLAGHHPK